MDGVSAREDCTSPRRFFRDCVRRGAYLNKQGASPLSKHFGHRVARFRKLGLQLLSARAFISKATQLPTSLKFALESLGIVERLNEQKSRKLFPQIQRLK